MFSCSLFSASCGTAQKATTEVAPAPAVEERQRPANRGERGDRGGNLDAEIAELGLSEAEAKTYKEINERYRKQLGELRRNSGGDRQKMAAEGGKIRAAQEREIIEMLSDAQREKYNAILEKRKTQMRNRQRGGRPGGKS